MTATSPISEIAIWGLGRVGTGFALALKELPISLHLFSSSEESRDRASALGLPVESSLDAWSKKAKHADIIAFGWSDDALPKALESCAFKPNVNQLILHFSGLLNADELGSTVALRASLHPLSACPTPTAAQVVFKNGPLVLEGSPDALVRLNALTQGLGADVHYLKEGQKAQYHAGAVLGSNAVVGLLHAALQEWESAGLQNADKLMLALARSALRASDDEGLKQGLTGPLKRADLGSLRRHLATLGADRVALYKMLNLQLVELLGESHFAPDVVLELYELLKKN